MKRSRLLLLAVSAAFVLLAASCDLLFTNQFKELGLGQVASTALSQAAATGDTTTIIAQSGLSNGQISQSFIAAVTSSSDTINNVLTALQTAAADTSAPPATQEAAKVLIVEIALEASGAKAMVDNIVSAIGSVDFSNFNINNPGSLAGLLAALFPARSARTLPTGWTVAQVADIIDTLAGTASTTYGSDFLNALGSLAAGLTGTGYQNSGVDAGFLAQVGIISTLLRQLTPLAPYGSIGDALAHLIDDYTTDPNATNPSNYVTFPGNLLTQIENNVDLQALFTAAGMNLSDLLSNFGS